MSLALNCNLRNEWSWETTLKGNQSKSVVCGNRRGLAYARNRNVCVPIDKVIKNLPTQLSTATEGEEDDDLKLVFAIINGRDALEITLGVGLIVGYSSAESANHPKRRGCRNELAHPWKGRKSGGKH